MEPAKLDELLSEIAQAINDEGGRFDVDYETHLYMARRSLPPSSAKPLLKTHP